MHQDQSIQANQTQQKLYFWSI